ncbi:Protein kinase domain-containing protein [Cladophialophora immunda]|nr:Protein kinase domain-containing protein [Cladophialophora immunda]
MAAERYAIFFPEADGYLFCGPLGKGAEGFTSVVRSIVDNQNYVRKKTKATSASSSHKEGIYCAEVSLYRPHPRIPALVHSQDFQVLPPGHPRAHDFKSTSMLFSYCNGGTLERFLAILERERILAPEVLVWHLLDNLFEAIEHLHRGTTSISHGDLHEGNIYLHFPTPESRLPEFFIGDLGMARPVDQSVWQVSGIPPTRQLRDINVIKDEDEQAQREHQIMRDVGVAPQDPPPQPPSRTKQLEPMLDDVKTIHSTLFRLLQGRGQNPNNMRYAPFRDGAWVNRIMSTDPSDYNAFVAHRPAVRDIAQRARETSDVLPDFQWTRQDRYRDDFPPGVSPIPPFPWTRYNQHLANHPALRARLVRDWQYTPTPEIRLFQTRHHLLQLSTDVPGPWKIARVAPGTLRVLAVEGLTFGLHVPSVKDNCPMTPSGRAFNHDDHLMVNHLVATDVDRVGIANIATAAMSSFPTPNQARLFDVDPEWSEERLSKQGQLTLRAPVFVPAPQPSLPAPEPPLPPPPASPVPPRQPSPTSSEEAKALEEAFTAEQTPPPPETEQAPAALHQTPPPRPSQTPPPQTPPPPPPPPQTPPQQATPVAQQTSPAASHQTPPAAQPAAEPRQPQRGQGQGQSQRRWRRRQKPADKKPSCRRAASPAAQQGHDQKHGEKRGHGQDHLDQKQDQSGGGGGGGGTEAVEEEGKGPQRGQRWVEERERERESDRDRDREGGLRELGFISPSLELERMGQMERGMLANGGKNS